MLALDWFTTGPLILRPHTQLSTHFLPILTGLANKKRLHHTYNIYLSSTSFVFLATLCRLIFYDDYAKTGLPKHGWRVAGDYLFAAGECSFMFMLICLAKGWTVVRRKISAQGRMRLAAYMTGYAISWLVALIWYSALPHGYKRVYVLGTSAGYVVLANRYVAICDIAFSLLNHSRCSL